MPLSAQFAIIHAMSTPSSLYLAPADPYATVGHAMVHALLRELGLIGEPLEPPYEGYLAGAEFSRHIIFAGCSPHLLWQPPDDGSPDFCHVLLHGPFPQPRLVTGANTVKPRCPACRQRLADWRERLPDWSAGRHDAQCPGCLRQFAACRLDWRQHAICGRLLVEFRNVFPGEATPGDRLLQHLGAASGQPWRYAWAGSLRA